MSLIISFGILAIGFAMLMKGADVFVEGASSIAARFGIPQLIIGLTIVAMGTSLPEAAVSITAVLKGSAGISIGNVIGSNIMNILLILGLTALVKEIPIQDVTFKVEIPFMLFVTVALIAFGYINNDVSRMEGCALWGLFIVYLLYLFRRAKNDEAEEAEDIKSLPVSLLMIVGGIACIYFGSEFAVSGASDIAKFFGMSDRLIGLTIVAFGTSLPELVTSVTAAKKGMTDIAIGNIVGSNIFNILFVIGTSSIIHDIVFASEFLLDGIMALGAGLILWASAWKTREINRKWGIIMLVVYAAYLVYTFMK